MIVISMFKKKKIFGRGCPNVTSYVDILNEWEKYIQL